MKILVTGGKGFIGSKIVEILSNEGHHVTVVDNEDTYDIMSVPQLQNLYTVSYTHLTLPTKRIV